MAPVALTIAGSDPGGAAGIQADLKTFAAFGVWGTSVVTALTAQDTTAVYARVDVEPAFVVAQLDAVLGDLPVAAAKTGMVGRVATVEAIAARLAAVPDLPLVVDPVLVATAGQTLGEPGLAAAVRRVLLPRAALVTPNLAEAEALVGAPVADVRAMAQAARALVAHGARAALVTGGHLAGDPVDVLWDGSRVRELAARRVGGRFHGAGCALSAAIAAGLAIGRSLDDAVDDARRWVADALAAAPALGRGARPLAHHVAPRRREQ